jgi:hypothetical protein
MIVRHQFWSRLPTPSVLRLDIPDDSLSPLTDVDMLNPVKRALGTASSDFVNASLLQLQVAAQLHCGGISEIAMNAALAMIEAAEPQNEIEGALAVQMACTHTAAISRTGSRPALPQPTPPDLSLTIGWVVPGRVSTCPE